MCTCVSTPCTSACRWTLKNYIRTPYLLFARALFPTIQGCSLVTHIVLPSLKWVGLVAPPSLLPTAACTISHTPVPTMQSSSPSCPALEGPTPLLGPTHLDLDLVYQAWVQQWPPSPQTRHLLFRPTKKLRSMTERYAGDKGNYRSRLLATKWVWSMSTSV